MADWYYAKNGKQQGPITSTQLRQLAQSGELSPDDLVFKEGGTNWIPASTVAGLFPAGGVAAKAAPAPAPAAAPRKQAEDGFDFDSGGDRGRDEDPIRRPPRSGSYWGDLFMFRRFVGPTVIVIIFYLFVVGICLAALLYAGSSLIFAIQVGGNAFLVFLGVVVVSLIGVPVYILVYRIFGELMIIQFRIHETLVEIKNELRKRDER